MHYIINALAVAIGGALGAMCRELGSDAITSLLPQTIFPYGILCVNVLGGLCMGLLQGTILRSGSPHTLLYSLLGTGFLGGFTTVSTFALDTYTLYAHSAMLAAWVNIFANASLCIAAAAVGCLLTGARVKPQTR